MIRGIDDLGAADHRRGDAADVVAVGVVAVIVNDDVRIGIFDCLDQFTDALRRAEPAMVFDAEQNLVAGDGKNLAHLLDVILVRMFRAGGKTDTRFKDLAGLLHLLEDRLHIGNVIEKVENAPDIDVFCKLAHRKTDDILRIGPVAEQVDAAAQSLKHGVRHLLPQQFEFQKGINLLAQDIHMHRGAAGDFQGKIICLFPGAGGKQVGMEENTILEIRLGEIAGGVGDEIAVRPSHDFQHFTDMHPLHNSVHG